MIAQWIKDRTSPYVIYSTKSESIITDKLLSDPANDRGALDGLQAMVKYYHEQDIPCPDLDDILVRLTVDWAERKGMQAWDSEDK